MVKKRTIKAYQASIAILNAGFSAKLEVNEYDQTYR